MTPRKPAVAQRVLRRWNDLNDGDLKFVAAMLVLYSVFATLILWSLFR